MYYKKIVLFSFLAFSLYKSDTDFVCKNYKYGTFSVFFDNSKDSYYTIIRGKVSQLEINSKGNKVYYNIEWINGCSYIQKFDEKKNKLTRNMKMLNDDGGMVIELLDTTKNKCINYQSYVKKFKNLSLRKGKFCKKEIITK